MMEWIQGLPLLAAWCFLYVVIFCRAGGTYLVGRLALRGAQRSRFRGLVDRPAVHRAEHIIERYGAPVVALSFLTIGFQTAAQAAAGAMRMPYRKYLPALLIGGAVWALIYATIGLAAFWVWFQVLLREPWIAVGLVVLVIGAATVVVVRRVNRTDRNLATDPAGTGDAAGITHTEVVAPHTVTDDRHG